MSNVPIPEPDWILEVRQWLQDRMHTHAAAVSAAKDAEIAALRDFVEHVRRNGSTHLAGMAIAVLAALEQKP